MKSLVFFGIIYVLLLPLLAIACDKAKPIEPIPTPTTQGNIVNLDLGDFSISKNITRDVELTNPGSFTLQLPMLPRVMTGEMRLFPLPT